VGSFTVSRRLTRPFVGVRELYVIVWIFPGTTMATEALYPSWVTFGVVFGVAFICGFVPPS
jgi:hypothetical protein